MSLLDELEGIKYRFVLDLIKEEEVYDKKRNTLTGEEVFKLCQDRYKMIEEILLPLKTKLGENIEIIDIGFANGMQDDVSILVRYNKNNRQNYFTISKTEFNEIDVSSSDNRLEKHGFVLSNRKIILDIFNRISDESLDSEFSINSTSSKFVIIDNCRSFTIKDINGKVFSIEGLHSQYERNGLLYEKEKVFSNYPKLKEILLSEDNIMNIYRNIKVYEEDFPKVLIKKTNR